VAGGPEAADAVVVEGVSKSFGANAVLRDISLAVPAHQVICLIGASGSGKSTLLRCINLRSRSTADRSAYSGTGSPEPGSTRTWSAAPLASSSSPTTCSRT
jgi:ABC-type transporter Mla maintaining outer membrane lipid asymmetry ATPase subunit MlaF